MKAINFDLVIVGVGGQGTLLASKILGRLALDAGLGVKVSEVHGMSQRGGSVITHVRVGDSVHSPLVSTGNADYLLSFEALEGARAAGYLKPEGILIVNTQRISPMSVITGATSGIGLRTAEIFVGEGAKIVIAGRRVPEGEALAKKLGANCVFRQTDITEEVQMQALIALAVDKFGRIDCLFNNAGGPAQTGGIEGLEVEKFDAAMATLVRSVMLGMKHAAPYMRKQGSGSIINNGSIAGRLAPADSVRGALAFVARGECPLGVVYATDAMAERRVRIVGVFPESSHPPIVYPGALVSGARNLGSAAALLGALQSPRAAEVFRQAGFGVLARPR